MQFIYGYSATKPPSVFPFSSYLCLPSGCCLHASDPSFLRSFLLPSFCILPRQYVSWRHITGCLPPALLSVLSLLFSPLFFLIFVCIHHGAAPLLSLCRHLIICSCLYTAAAILLYAGSTHNDSLNITVRIHASCRQYIPDNDNNKMPHIIIEKGSNHILYRQGQ